MVYRWPWSPPLRSYGAVVGGVFYQEEVTPADVGVTRRTSKPKLVF